MAGRLWFARDANLTADPKIELLGERFGAAGVLAFEELLAVAKLADDGGRAMMAFTQLAKRALVRPRKTAEEIVSMCADLGLVELEACADGVFTYRVPKWTRWNDPKAAERKRKQRERDGNVTPLKRDIARTSL